MLQPAVQPFNPAELPLRDYHLPPPVSWWPPAPGWWGLGLLSLLLLTALVFFYARWRRQAWRRAARHQLTAIGLAYGEHGDDHRLARELSKLIRRVCLTRFPERSGSDLHGHAWLEHLDSLTGRKKRAASRVFAEHGGRELLRAAYDPGAEIDGQGLVLTCRQWLDALPPARRGRV